MAGSAGCNSTNDAWWGVQSGGVYRDHVRLVTDVTALITALMTFGGGYSLAVSRSNHVADLS